MKCENCNKYEARTRDYRDVDGMVGKHLHCRWCANLNNVALYQIRTENLDPVMFYDSIDFSKLSIEELEELHDIAYCKISEQLEDDSILDKLLEYERYLALREEQSAK